MKSQRANSSIIDATTVVGLDGTFQALVEAALQKVASERLAECELTALRRHLASYHGEFQGMYARLFESTFGADRSSEVLAILRTPEMQLYFAARSRIGSSLKKEMAKLSEDMRSLVC